VPPELVCGVSDAPVAPTTVEVKEVVRVPVLDAATALVVGAVDPLVKALPPAPDTVALLPPVTAAEFVVTVVLSAPPVATTPPLPVIAEIWTSAIKGPTSLVTPVLTPWS